MKFKEKFGWGGLVLFLLIPFLFAIYTWMTAGQMRYTIAIVVDIQAAKGNFQPVYKFDYAGQTIQVRGSINSMIDRKNIHSHVGKKYYIMFDESKPKHSDILLDYPVPDSIQSAPLNGWDSIPGVGQLENPFVWQAGKSPPVKKK